MKNITKKDMIRRSAKINVGLGDDFTNLVEGLVAMIKSEPVLLTMDIKSAIELCMLDLEVENASFYDVLKPYYNENYDLIPIVGIDGVMNLAVQDFLTEQVLKDEIVTIIGRIIAFDHMTQKAKDGVSYSQDIITFVNDLIPTSYYDIQEMLSDVDLGLDITEVRPVPKKKKCAGCKDCTCGSKKKVSAPQIKVVVLDNDKMADDILALLKLINGGK